MVFPLKVNCLTRFPVSYSGLKSAGSLKTDGFNIESFVACVGDNASKHSKMLNKIITDKEYIKDTLYVQFYWTERE